MAVTGKTGADAIFVALTKICHVIAKYHAKLDAVIDAAHTAGVIDSTQQAAAHAFVDAATVTCDIFRLISGYSGF